MAQVDNRPAEVGIIRARPAPPKRRVDAGLHTLGPERKPDGLLFVPEGYAPDTPVPLLVALHGSDGDALGGIAPFMSFAHDANTVIVAPQSRGVTWDMILGEYGPDIVTLDRMLAYTFNRCSVDPSRVAIAGFSDGATYALAVGLGNSDLFTHVIALSPGFAAPASQDIMPSIYISHGTQDAILPIDVCSRSIVARLRRAGYAVHYREFEGEHNVPVDIGRGAVDWFVGASLSHPSK